MDKQTISPYKTRILICGILPPPFFGHSAMYGILMKSTFLNAYQVAFLNMKFWSYGQHKKVTLVKLWKLIQYLFQYIFLIGRERPHYVLYNISFDKMPFLKDFLFCFLGRILGVRIVLHDMGQYVRELYNQSNIICRGLIRWLLRHATASIVLGKGTKLVYKGLMDEKKIFVVPGSVEDTAVFHVGETISKGKRDKVNVLYFSFMTESKGILTAFRSVPRVLDKNHHVRFTFAGPIQSEFIQETFDHLCCQYNSHITYLGYIKHISERTAVYRNADIFIFPTHRDVFGLVLLHAMAEGLPIIASIEGTIPEIIEDGVNGFLIPKEDDAQLAEMILRLADDEELRKRMGRLNRERYVQVYAPPIYGQRMIDTFAKINKLDSCQ